MSFPNLGPFPNLSKANESSFSGLTGAPGDNTALAAALDGKADSADITTHTGNTSNPHSVTAAQAGAIPAAEKGANNGVATLDSDGQVPTSQVPPIALNVAVDVADEAARLALTTEQVQPGDVATQLDDDSIWWLRAADPSQASSWLNITSEVTLPEDSDDIANLSTVTGSTVTDALETLDSIKQPQNDLLSDVAGLTLSGAAGQLVGVNSGETDLELKSAGSVRTFLNLIVGSTVQAFSSLLASLSGVSVVAGDLIYGSGTNAVSRLPKGTALQQLRINSGATAPEWFTPAGAIAGYGARFMAEALSSDGIIEWNSSIKKAPVYAGSISAYGTTGFTAGTTGVYLVFLTVAVFFTSTAAEASVKIYVDGTYQGVSEAYTPQSGAQDTDTASTEDTVTVIDVISLTAGQRIEAYFNEVTGTAAAVRAGFGQFVVVQIA